MRTSIREDTRRVATAVPRHGIRPLGIDRRRPELGTVQGRQFPAVAVRDLAIQPRDNDLVLATHGRGIWIVDDITPLRGLDAGGPVERGGVRTGTAVAAAHRRSGRLGQGRGGLRGRQSHGRRGDHLLPEVAPPVRQAEARGAGRERQGHGRAAGQPAPGSEPRRLVDAREAAARAAGGAARRSRARRARWSCRGPTPCA